MFRKQAKAHDVIREATEASPDGIKLFKSFEH